MADLSEIAESLNVKLAEREPAAQRRSNGQKRRSWLIEEETQEPQPVAVQAAAPVLSQATEVRVAPAPQPVEVKAAPVVVPQPVEVKAAPIAQPQPIEAKVASVAQPTEVKAAPKPVEKPAVKKIEPNWQPFVWPNA